MAKNKLYWEKEKKRGEKEGKRIEKEKRKKEEKSKKENKRRKKKKERGEGWGKQSEFKKNGGVSSDSVYFKSFDFPWNLSVYLVFWVGGACFHVLTLGGAHLPLPGEALS